MNRWQLKHYILTPQNLYFNHRFNTLVNVEVNYVKISEFRFFFSPILDLSSK